MIEKQQELIALLKEKRQAVISHAVTKGLNPQAPLKDSGIEWLGQVPKHWKVTRVKALSSLISKGTTPSTVGSGFSESGVRFLKAENILETGKVSKLPEFFISEVTHRTLRRSELKAHDVLVVIAGATTGKSAVLLSDMLPGNTNQAVSFIRPHVNEHARWIALSLSTPETQNVILLDSVQAAQPNLAMEDLGNLSLALPPLPEMKDILKNLEGTAYRFTRLLAAAETQITLLQERRTALISAAVTGKIDVRDWEPPTEPVTTVNTHHGRKN